MNALSEQNLFRFTVGAYVFLLSDSLQTQRLDVCPSLWVQCPVPCLAQRWCWVNHCWVNHEWMNEWVSSLRRNFSSLLRTSLVAQMVKASAYNAGDLGLIPGLGRSTGDGNGNPLQYSCLKNLMDRGAWWATVHGVAKSQTWLKQLSRHVQEAYSGHVFLMP